MAQADEDDQSTATQLLSAAGEVDPAVRDGITWYLRALVLALPASLVFRTIYALGTAVSRPKTVMTINLLSVAFKLLFNWLFIFGKLGIPAMGAAGAGLSTAVVVAGDDSGPPARQLAEAAGWPLLAEPTSGARTGDHAIRTYRLLLGTGLGQRIERVPLDERPGLPEGDFSYVLEEVPGALFFLGLTGALFSASGYVGAFMRASNAIYEVEEGRPFWKLRPVMFLVTVVAVILIAVALDAWSRRHSH